MVKIIIIGFGNVGRCLLEIIKKQHRDLQEKYGFKGQIVAICELEGAIVNEEGIDIDSVFNMGDITAHPNWKEGMESMNVIQEVPADFMVECAWTNNETGEPALSHVKNALEQKMNVVSSNKGPFYLKYKELKQLAKEKGVDIGIESTVGSAIPCLASKESLSGTNIKSVRAILNGTSNYILTRMTTEKLSFDLALKEAQDLGYAEADPTLDIEGYDAAGKMVILANELLGWDKTISDVEVEGITNITPQAIELASIDGYYIKHVGTAKDGEISVGLQMVKRNSPLAVNGTLNVVELQTENAGPITFVGRGAGGSEAASGILSDLIRISGKNKS